MGEIGEEESEGEKDIAEEEREEDTEGVTIEMGVFEESEGNKGEVTIEMGILEESEGKKVRDIGKTEIQGERRSLL